MKPARKDETSNAKPSDLYWATPRTITGGGETLERKKELGRQSGGSDLQAQTEQLWQTPATDSFRSRGGDRIDEMGLDQQARYFPTPAARDYRSESGGAKTMSHFNRAAGPSLPAMLEYSNFLSSLQGQTLPAGQTSSVNVPTSRQRFAISTGSFLPWDRLVYCRWAWNATQRGWARPYVRPCLRPRLNPAFASWLMGWCPGMESALHPSGSSEMASFLSRGRWHLQNFFGE